MWLQRSHRQKHGSGVCVKCILPQIQRKYTHKQCYSRHVIPFLPVIRSKDWQYLSREIGGLFRDCRCYRRFIIAGVLVEIGFLCARRNFPFYRDGFRLCHRPPIQPLSNALSVSRSRLTFEKTLFRLFTFRTW